MKKERLNPDEGFIESIQILPNRWVNILGAHAAVWKDNTIFVPFKNIFSRKSPSQVSMEYIHSFVLHDAEAFPPEVELWDIQTYVHELFHLKQIDYLTKPQIVWMYIKGWFVLGSSNDPLEEDAYDSQAIIAKMSPKRIRDIYNTMSLKEIEEEFGHDHPDDYSGGFE